MRLFKKLLKFATQGQKESTDEHFNNFCLGIYFTIEILVN